MMNLDRWITSSPEDQPDICDECAEEECSKDCLKLKEFFNNQFKAMKEEEDKLYRAFLQDLTQAEIKSFPSEIQKDWKELHNQKI